MSCHSHFLQNCLGQPYFHPVLPVRDPVGVSGPQQLAAQDLLCFSGLTPRQGRHGPESSRRVEAAMHAWDDVGTRRRRVERFVGSEDRVMLEENTAR